MLQLGEGYRLYQTKTTYNLDFILILTYNSNIDVRKSEDYVQTDRSDRRNCMDNIGANELRTNLKKYLDHAMEGEIVKVKRKNGENILIVSEKTYNELETIQRYTAYQNWLKEHGNKEG